MTAPAIPNISGSAGPSAASSDAQGASQGSTGEFNFKSQPKTAYADVLKFALPIVALGVIAWALSRRK